MVKAQSAQLELKDGVGELAADSLPSNYEAALVELEALIRQMEEGGLSLEASLNAYRRGVSLMTYCRLQLEKVEQQVRVLDGEMLKPLETGNAPLGT